MSFLKNLALNVRRFAVAHKFISAIIMIVVIGAVYYGYQATHGAVTVTKYVIQDAAPGTVIASVSGSGQVQAVTSIDVKPQVTETVTKVYVQPGDAVVAGQLLVQLDPTNEQKALQQAQLSLQSAQLSLAKLQEAPATTTLAQDENAVTQDQESIVTASTTLAKDYQSGFDTVSSAFIDFQTVMTGLQDFATGNDVSKLESNPDAYVNLMPTYLQGSTLPYREEVATTYQAAVAAYQRNLIDYHAASRASSAAALNALYAETYQTAQTISEAVKSGKDLINFVVNNYPTGQGFSPLPSVTNTFQTNLGNYTATLDGDVTNLADTQSSITTDDTNLNNANLSLQEAQDALTALQAGADPLDVQSQNLSIQQAQLSVQTAEQNLAYTSVRAPITGIVSVVDAIAGETVPSPAVSIVGSGEEALVTLNEIDAAKVALGDKATLTFDALPSLSLAGKVIELDPVGTVSQGVVNYNVKIGFAQPANTSSSNQAKPGMSVTANIVTQADQNVIALPNSAVKTSGTASYVLEPSASVSAADVSASAAGGITLPAAPKMVPVTVGLSNDTLTEITSGVNVGDQVITQTITTSASTASTPAAGGTSALRALGVGGGGGGFGGGAGGGTFRAAAGGAAGR
jgi:multidrug efflux pump subunit AcrA (membrane-fusion protein)